MGTSLQPIARAMRAQGKVVNEVMRFTLNKDRLIFSYQLGDAAKNVPLVKRNAALNKKQGAEEQRSRGSYRILWCRGLVLWRRRSEAISLTCTHQGCMVSWQMMESFTALATDSFRS